MVILRVLNRVVLIFMSFTDSIVPKLLSGRDQAHHLTFAAVDMIWRTAQSVQ